MPVTDLFSASRRILRKLLGRSRHIALAASLVPLGSVGASIAAAAPVVSLPPQFPATPFSVRVTDMERVPGDPEGNAFRVELELVNWANRGADALMMAANHGATTLAGAAPHLSGASIDPNGRGGSPGGSDIGPGAYDPVPFHNGNGRGDSPSFINDWSLAEQTQSFVRWDNFDLTKQFGPYDGSTVFSKNLLADYWDVNYRVSIVPGYGVDGLGDSAFDGGPAPYSPSGPGSGPLDNDVNKWGNSLDGFVIDIDDWDEGEVFSLNWYLAALQSTSSGAPYTLYSIAPDSPFGSGVMSLVRLAPSIGTPAGSLPGPVFAGNVGFDQSNNSFFGGVYEIPNPAEFAAEFGTGLTAPFLNPGDNIFSLPINTQLVAPEPGAVFLVGAGLAGFASARNGRRRRDCVLA